MRGLPCRLAGYDKVLRLLEVGGGDLDRGRRDVAECVEVVDADEPPLRVFFGKGPLELIKVEYARRIAIWEKWNKLSVTAHGNGNAR